ncbi:DsbA family protein [Rhizohabitans arisaemae]|uniref:DsbA family protein n=1 Tax=Rhizohabitans arisaemae TaxID=2720610 RepID=UPI0024B23AF7|nr:thioredoxin domain-containing protein [Rhizohabitans arisaemae]
MGKSARDSARERVRAEREREEKRARRNRRIVVSSVVLAAVVLVGLFSLVQYNRNFSAKFTGTLAPITVQPDGTVVMAKPGVQKPVLDIYEDFQCPACKTLEDASGETVKELAAQGKVKVVYHPITIFQQDPLKSNSVRAASALRCVPGGTPWMNLHDRLFAEQPTEGKNGFELADLVAWGKEAGAAGADYESCVKNQTHAPAHIKFSEDTVAGSKIEGTPTVRLNGKELGNEAFVPGDLKETIMNAAK